LYYRYRVDRRTSGARYRLIEQVKLFGCNVGQIPAMLRAGSLGSADGVVWHLAMEGMLGTANEALVISLKPNNKDPRRTLSLYELRDVWGISDNEWTRLMLRLRGLVVDNQPPISDPDDFQLDYEPYHESIFTFLYVDGSVDHGAITGRWLPSRPSPTNSLLLWPDDFRQFTRIVRQVVPYVLDITSTRAEE